MRLFALFLIFTASALAKSNHKELAKLVARAGSYRLVSDLRGRDFLDTFDFEAGSDPNGGASVYVNEAQARRHGLASVKNGAVRLSLDTTKKIEFRKSVKLVSKKAYNSGLFILDVEHLPSAPGLWPAHWMVSKGKWPDNGEIDIIEFVHDFTQNSNSLHTGSGCTMSRKGFTSDFMLDKPNANNCASEETNNQGCGLRETKKAIAGAPFNRNNGGVWATEWTDEAISIWFFSRDDIPSNISRKRPNPNSWGTPSARFAGFNMSKCVQDQHLIFNTLACGTWAEGAWNSVNKAAGQTKSAAQQTGYDSCLDYVRNNGQDFEDAYWSILSLQIYK